MRSFVKLLAVVALLAPAWASAQESATVSVQSVALRDKPADDGKMLWQLSRGDNVTVLAHRGEWTRVRLRVTKGWVRSNALVAVADKSAPAAHATRSSASHDRAPVRRSAAPRGDMPESGFRPGENALGPMVGLGGINGTVAVGGEFEHAIKVLPDLANGTLGISAQAFYYHYAPIAGISVTTIPIGASANYHFALRDQRFDPFVGLGLGYAFASASVSGYTISSGSGLYFWGRGGLRYWVKPNLALHGDIGLGSATLNVGVMFRP